MDTINPKPKLLFFQFKYGKNVPNFLLGHKQEHVKCLSHFFDVILVREDCDYQQLCEKHKPDLALFETGLQVRDSHRLDIKNVRTCPQVPKLGFLNADAWADTREGILSDMDHWGVGTYFSICVTAAEHMPEIAQNLFVWPNFVDPELYKNYNESKIVPVLLTGCQDAQYPWRHKVYKLVSQFYPTLACPHGGYFGRSEAGRFLYGEQYARTINASWFVPTCGTVAKEVVRKHLEIPGSMACLITEQSPGLEAAGFVDMKNCVFADEHTVLDKLSYLFQQPDELLEIINAGYRLVHTQHTMKQRDQIAQWFCLNKNLQDTQKIVQSNPFGPLRVVDKSSKNDSCHIISNGLHLVLLRQADKLLWAGNYQEAGRMYLKCSNYIGGMMAEPKLKMALCNLYTGDPNTALALIVGPIRTTLAGYKAIDPDPVEWAYFIICLICLGKLKQAIKRSGQFPWLSHPELNRVRAVIGILKNDGATVALPDNDVGEHRHSIHELPGRSFDEWIRQLCIMLRACRQFTMETALTESLSQGMLVSRKTDAKSQPRPVFQEKATLQRFDNPLLYVTLKKKLSFAALKCLNRLGAKLGGILPWHLPDIRDDELFGITRRLFSEENIKTALFLGALAGDKNTEIFLSGIQENEHKPSVYCISVPAHEYGKPQMPEASFVKWLDIYPFSQANFQEQLEKTVKGIAQDNKSGAFDALLIDTSKLDNHPALNGFLRSRLHEAQVILLYDVNSCHHYNDCQQLIKNAGYSLIHQNLSLRDGYAVFKKLPVNLIVPTLPHHCH